MGYRILTGGYNNSVIGGILDCTLDEKGALVGMTPINGVENPTFLCMDGSLMFAINQNSSICEAVCYDISGGSARIVNQKRGAGYGACHISVNTKKKLLAVACYASGDVTVFSYSPSGIGELVFTKNYNEAGVISHPHCMTVSPDGEYFYLVDLGRDRLVRYSCADTFTPDGELLVKEKDGPRHLMFYKNRGFLVTEYSNVLYSMDYKDGELKFCSCASTLDFKKESYGASVAQNPVTGHIYVSNRGADNIAVFDCTDELTLLGNVGCGGIWPRHIALTHDGKFLMAANERSNEISILPIDLENGFPRLPVTKINARGASFVMEI